MSEPRVTAPALRRSDNLAPLSLDAVAHLRALGVNVIAEPPANRALVVQFARTLRAEDYSIPYIAGRTGLTIEEVIAWTSMG